jgi:RNA polymerase sigma factor (sigma-70 family)
MAPDPPPPVWQAIEPYTRFVQLLARRFAAAKSSLDSEDPDDLYQEFVVERLPTLIARLARLPEQDRERYLVVVFRNFVREHQRNAGRYRRAIDALAAEPADSGPWPHEQPSLATDALPISPVLREYFGAGGSLRRVAKAFGLTRHGARKAVVDDTLALALHRGSTDDLSSRERAVCWRVLLEGSTLEDAARSLGLTESQVRASLARARARISRRLTTSHGE